MTTKTKQPGFTGRLLSFEDLRERGINFSRKHVQRLTRKGKFPRPVHLGPWRTAWVEQEIDQWLADRLAERPGSSKAA